MASGLVRALSRGWKAIAAIAAILIVVLPALFLSSTFQHCVNSIPGYAFGEHQREGLPYFLFFQVRLVGCTGPFVDANANAIIAVFTIILAVSTILLWQSTDKLVQSGKEALEVTERAFVYLDDFVVELSTLADFDPNSSFVKALGAIDPTLHVTRFAVMPRWKNGGTTPTKNMWFNIDGTMEMPIQSGRTEDPQVDSSSLRRLRP